MIKPVDLAYIAGIVDGEGYVGIKRSRPYRHLTGRVNPSYSARLQIRMVDEEAIAFIATSLGGWYYSENPSVKNGRPLFCFQASDKRGLSILKQLRPYLRVKRRQVDILLEFEELKASPQWAWRTKQIKSRWGKMIAVRRRRYSPEYIAKLDSLWRQCRSLNRAG